MSVLLRNRISMKINFVTDDNLYEEKRTYSQIIQWCVKTDELT